MENKYSTKTQEDNNLIVRPFSEERMGSIIAEFKTKEFESGITKCQVFAESNLIYLVKFRKQHVTVETEYESYSYYDSGMWIGQDVEAYLYFELSNYTEEVQAEKIREQLFYRLIKKKIHIGIKPWVTYNVTIVKKTNPDHQSKEQKSTNFLTSVFSSFSSSKEDQNKDQNNSFDCLIRVDYDSDEFCPEFLYFSLWLGAIPRILRDSILNPNLELTSEDIESFLSDGEEKGFYSDKYFVEYDYDYDDYDSYEEDEVEQRLQSFRRFVKIH